MVQEKREAAASPTFEQALEEIEDIVAKIEGGELPLDQVVDKFKRAAELIRISTSLLAEVEQQIKRVEPELLKAAGRQE